jgi:hypothetical protein
MNWFDHSKDKKFEKWRAEVLEAIACQMAIDPKFLNIEFKGVIVDTKQNQPEDHLKAVLNKIERLEKENTELKDKLLKQKAKPLVMSKDEYTSAVAEAIKSVADSYNRHSLYHIGGHYLDRNAAHTICTLVWDKLAEKQNVAP